MNQTLLDIAWSLADILIVVVPLLVAVAYFTFVERKVIGYMQHRYGPNRVGFRGMLQPLADALKLACKETIRPSASSPLFLLGPVLVMAPALLAWAVVPFSSHWFIVHLNASTLYLLAMTSFGIYGVILAGWGSNSRYPFLGALRASAQTISYELAMGFALVGVLMWSGSSDLIEIVTQQAGGIWHWLFIPLFPLFVIHWISAIAETNRAPFDLAEGESELVAGFMVEYSSLWFALFFLSEYANMILMCFISALLYLGGWLSPFQGIPYLDGWFHWVPGFVWLLLKAGLFAFLYLWIRATFPRYRYDQLMRLGWKVFIPLACIWLAVLGVWLYFRLAIV